MRRNNEEFAKVCREEAEAGEVVVVGGCISDFPCLANIFVYAGLDDACPSCGPQIQKMRDLSGWESDGEFWNSKNITSEQQRVIGHQIAIQRSRRK